MLFFGKKKATSADAKKSGITVGSLFNPNIGASIRPLGQTGQLLVSLIAAIFAAHRLFPRNHPALLNVPNAPRLTFGEVMGTGWNNLVWKKENIGQILIFFAVILSLGCSGLALLVVALTMFSGAAHAQAPGIGPGMFQPVSPANDIACGWINWLFQVNAFGCVLPNYLPNGQQVANLQPVAMQTALITALAFYSNAILIVAAIILFYHLASMVAETAHQGVVMGRRANQIWAPIRLVVAIGLLVPINSGLNSGQFIVLQIAQWGSGMASQAWNLFLQELANQAYTLPNINAPYARTVVHDIMLMQACTAAYNAAEDSAAPQFSLIPPNGRCTPLLNGGEKCTFTPEGAAARPSDTDICGFYIIKPPLEILSPVATAQEQAAAQVLNAQTGNALGNLLTATAAIAQQNASQFISQADGGNAGSGVQSTTGFDTLVGNYLNDLQAAFDAASAAMQGALGAAAQVSAAYGWVTAGSWWNTIVRLVTFLTTGSDSMLPLTTRPQVDRIVSANNFGPGTSQYAALKATVSFQQWIETTPPDAGFTTGGNAQQRQLQLAAADIVRAGSRDEGFGMDKIFWVVDYIASWDGVWQANPNNGDFTL
ncbi:MAG: DotA/TraY family protein, partial [Bdellovibrionales bacterium]